MKSALIVLTLALASTSSEAFENNSKMILDSCFKVTKANAETMLVCATSTDNDLHHFSCGAKPEICFFGDINKLIYKINNRGFMGSEMGLDYAYKALEDQVTFNYYDLGNVCEHTVSRCKIEKK